MSQVVVAMELTLATMNGHVNGQDDEENDDGGGRDNVNGGKMKRMAETTTIVAK